MTNEQILLAAIKKAEENGYDSLYDIDFGNFIKEKGYTWQYGEDKWSNRNQDIHINEILFDHEFAKAFWGEQYVVIANSKDNSNWETEFEGENWEHELQKMAISEDRIQYLKQYL